MDVCKDCLGFSVIYDSYFMNSKMLTKKWIEHLYPSLNVIFICILSSIRRFTIEG